MITTVLGTAFAIVLGLVVTGVAYVIWDDYRKTPKEDRTNFFEHQG